MTRWLAFFPARLQGFARRILPPLLLCLLCSPQAARAQGIDSLLRIQSLSRNDIVQFHPEKEEIVYGANRIAESTEELAVRTLVITREEISGKGYTTLCDVLRNVPGIRTSEPGHALVGDMFLMRGLEGNLYCKILINGIALLPSAAPGVSLGANLPIRQAERIEIIFGPATTVYGTDAVSGVINIVLPQPERPLETMANVSLGNGGTDEFHLSIGGKGGNRKNVFTYRILGSTRRTLDVQLNYPDSLYLLDTTDQLVATSPRDGIIPVFTTLRHESRVLALQVGYKGFTLMGSRLYRRDHSIIGAHPQEVACFNPSASFAESVDNLQLQYDNTVGKLWMHTNVSALFYNIDRFSNYQPLDHPFVNGVSFVYARSRDFNFEQLFNLSLGRFSVLMGGNYLAQSGVGFQSFLSGPFSEESIITDSLGNTVVANNAQQNTLLSQYFPYSEYVHHNLGIFTQGVYRTKRMNLSGGIRLDKRDTNELQWSPKLGLNVQLAKGLRLRATASRAFRVPGAYYEFNNYQFEQLPNEPQPSYKKVRTNLKPEELLNLEGGFTWQVLPGFKVEGHFTHTSMNNRIFPIEEFVVDSIPLQLQRGRAVGYGNINSLAVLNSLETFVEYKNKWLSTGFSIQYNTGFERIDTLDTLHALRSMPQWMGQAWASVYVKNWFRLSVNARYTGSFISWASIKGGNIVEQETDGFFVIDALIGRPVTRRLDLYVRVKNLTNTYAKGITASFLARTRAEYNPQEGRMIFVGLTFNLN